MMELAVTADEFLLPGLLALCEWELCQPRVRACVCACVCMASGCFQSINVVCPFVVLCASLSPSRLISCWNKRRQHLEGAAADGGEGSCSSKAVELFLLTDMLSGGKRGMPLLRAQAAVVIVRRFHQLPAVASEGPDDDEEQDEEGEEGQEGGERTIGREEVLKAALECLMGV